MGFLSDRHPEGEKGRVRVIKVADEECQACEAERKHQPPEQLMAMILENDFQIKMCRFCIMEIEMSKLMSNGHHPGCDGHCNDNEDDDDDQ